LRLDLEVKEICTNWCGRRLQGNITHVKTQTRMMPKAYPLLSMACRDMLK
jgi:hypothetical protein